MKWDQFNKETKFEELIFELTSKSILLIQESSLPEKNFSAFAFNCFSLHGDILLSLGVNPGYEAPLSESDIVEISLGLRVNPDDLRNKKNRLYPPDWEYELIEHEIPKIGDIWKARY